jgi:fructose-1,6-bisphosphatase I
MLSDQIVLEQNLSAKGLSDTTEGDLAGVILAIVAATKAIASKVRCARISDVLGMAGDTNIHGEAQQKLDVLADSILLKSLSDRSDVAVFASEEQDHPVVLGQEESRNFCVVTDPLDGSSNIDVAVSVGTIFSILGVSGSREIDEAAVLQKGSMQIAAGYVLYGSSVVLVLSTGEGVDMYVLDPLTEEFFLVEEGLRVPKERKIYSVNEAYWEDFSDGVRAYLDFAHKNGYGSRYIGSMVADVHRTLLKGGVFIYPSTTKAPHGKLRLLYEGNPMAYLLEQAGGQAVTEQTRIVEVVPTEFHQRTSVILGSAAEVSAVSRFL